MGRLIDADELKKCIEGSTWNDILELVDEQQTAYDVVKVVEELKNAGFSDESAPNRVVAIVKKGGVEQ